MRNERLTNQRHTRGMTQAEVAQKVGVQIRTYQSYEYNTISPNVETALKIANALGCRVEDIFNLPGE